MSQFSLINGETFTEIPSLPESPQSSVVWWFSDRCWSPIFANTIASTSSKIITHWYRQTNDKGEPIEAVRVPRSIRDSSDAAVPMTRLAFARVTSSRHNFF